MTDNFHPNTEDEAAQDALREMSIATAGEMRHTAYSLAQVSQLSQLQIEELIDDVSALVPAGNVPNMILNGLARMQQDKSTPPSSMRKDIRMIFRGMGQMLDHASYRLLVNVPARAILAYQKMLELAGFDLDQAFEHGTWQFYVDYALREDTARHTMKRMASIQPYVTTALPSVMLTG